MPRVSKSPLATQQIEELSEHFTYLLTSLTNKRDIDQFLTEFLTTEEKIMMGKRLMLFILLSQKYPEPTIKRALHLSHETIRTYAHLLPTKTSQFHILIQKLVQRQQTKNFLKKIEHILGNIQTLTQVKTNMKSRAKIASGEVF